MSTTMTTTTPHRMFWFAMLAGLLALALGEATVTEVDTAANETASSVGPMTTDAPPPREAVTDMFAAPLASFKVPIAPSANEEPDLTGLPLGKADNATDSASPPPFSNLWFNAGQSLGSAANSLTGWLNSRLGTQTTTTTTTKPPEVIVRVQSQQGKRKPLIAIEPNRNPLGNRISPGKLDEDDDEDDDDEDVDDEDYDAGGEEEEADDDETTPNRHFDAEDEEDDDEELNDDEVLEDDDEEDVNSIKTRTKFVPPKRANRKGYTYQANDDDSAEDYEDDDEDVDDYVPAKIHSPRQQQQQSLFNRFRQLAQMPYSSNNKKQATKQPNKGYRPVRIVQNGQVIQLVEDRPSQQKVKRQRRPSANQSAYQIIPIQANQISGGGRPQQNKRRVTKPQDNANNLYIPLPQGSSGGNSGQYITIPWAKLGIGNKQQDSTQNGQQAPFVVNIPQFQTGNRRRPGAQATNPQRKRLKRPMKNQNGKFVSILSEQNIRDIFKIPEIPPSRTPLTPLEVPVDDDSTSKPVAINPETEVVSEEDDDDDMQDEGQDPYIVVGEEKGSNEAMSRHASASRSTHNSGMKPYVDVLNKGRIYLKPGWELRRSRELNPQISKPIDGADKDVIRSLETSSETKSSDSPSLVGSDDTGNRLPQQQ